MKNVSLIVLNNFKNDSRVLKEAKFLAKSGFNVKVIALHDNSELKEFDQIDGIFVHRIKLKSKEWSKNKFIQIFKYFEFVYKFIKLHKNNDFIHCNDLNTLPIGVIVKVFFNKNVRIIYDAHEYETQINGLHGLHQKLVKFLEKSLIKYADEIITVSKSIAEQYAKIYGIKTPHLVLNTPPFKQIVKKNLFREKFNISEQTQIFLYQGGLSSGRGIEIILESFKNLYMQKNADLAVIFMGYGPLENMIKNHAKKYKNIYFHEAVDPNILLEFSSSADFGILFYEDNCLNHRYCSPNKIFEYLMAELIVIVSNLTEMKRLVNTHEIGIVAKQNSPKELEIAIKEALNLDKNKLIKNIQKAKKIYNWEEQEKILREVYRC